MATARKTAPAKQVAMKITDQSILIAADAGPKPQSAFTIPTPAPGVLPKGNKGMAMDGSIANAYAYAAIGATYAEGLQFLGYPYLAELTQRAEYRRPAEIVAKHMTRKWIRLQAKGDEGESKAEKLAAIEEEMKRLNVQGVFREAIEADGFFGRAQIYIDTGVDRENDADELKTPLALTPNKIGRDSLERLAVVEPLWTYPSQYDATDPLSKDFYKAKSWFVMGKEIHGSRLLTIVSRQVPDILKPAYMFGGLSLSQISKPYVDNWLRTRQSVADLLHSFSVFGLKTNMSTVLAGGSSDDLRKRAQLFNQHRDNRNLMLIDRDTEDFFNVSAPLGSLDKLQAQSQEHMSAVNGIPLSILLGITPSGLNASTEGEIRQFYDWIAAQQEGLTALLTYILQVIQLSKFGEIDSDISFMWEPLWSMDAKQLSELRKSDAEADAIYIDRAVISPHESRARLAADEDSPYASLDLEDDPPPINPAAEGDPSGEGHEE